MYPAPAKIRFISARIEAKSPHPGTAAKPHLHAVPVVRAPGHARWVLTDPLDRGRESVIINYVICFIIKKIILYIIDV